MNDDPRDAPVVRRPQPCHGKQRSLILSFSVVSFSSVLPPGCSPLRSHILVTHSCPSLLPSGTEYRATTRCSLTIRPRSRLTSSPCRTRPHPKHSPMRPPPPPSRQAWQQSRLASVVSLHPTPSAPLCALLNRWLAGPRFQQLPLGLGLRAYVHAGAASHQHVRSLACPCHNLLYFILYKVRSRLSVP